MNTSMSDNQYYPEVCKVASSNESVFSRFKQIPAYTQILEHTTRDLGFTYLQYLLEKHNPKEIVSMCASASVNDSVGGTHLCSYNIENTEINISPSTIRYIKVLSDLCDIGDISSMNICEIGGGYGGQCLVSNVISGFSSWDIIDIPEANMLQEKYLTENKVESVRFFSMDNIDNIRESYDLVISNYAFSECTREIQDVYVEKILKNSLQGYMTMNFISGYDNVYSFSDLQEVIPSIDMHEENPSSYHTNKLFTWGI